MEDENPYAAPQSGLTVPAELADESRIAGVDRRVADLPIASRNRRFLNHVIDSLVLKGLQYGVEWAIASMVAEGEVALTGLQRLFLELVLGSSYFIVLEQATGQTIGKFLTRTRVVDEGGWRPTFGQVLARTLCRFIPFDAISFLFGRQAIGWHDSIPKTRVVRNTVKRVARID